MSCSQSCAHANDRLYSEATGNVQKGVQFAELLQDDNGVDPQLPASQDLQDRLLQYLDWKPSTAGSLACMLCMLGNDAKNADRL